MEGWEGVRGRAVSSKSSGRGRRSRRRDGRKHKVVIGFNHTCAGVVVVDKGEAEHVVVVKQVGDCGA